MSMSAIITESFTSERELGNQMYHTLLERMTFENKRASFQSIVYSLEEGNRTKYSAIFKELSALNNLRNQFAHYPMVPLIRENDTETAITLAKFRDKPNVIRFTLNEMENIIERIVKIDYKLDQAFKREKFSPTRDSNA